MDDDEAFAEVAADMLEREHPDIDVEVVSDGSRALELLDEDGFDCVVSDLEMPGLSGIELLERVRERYGDLPFFLFTGRGSEEVAGDAISAGVTDYLQKSGDGDQYKILANRIVNAVEAMDAEREARRNRRRFEALSDAFPDVAFLIDADGRYLEVVAGEESPLLYDEAEALEGRTFDEALPEDVAERFQDAVDRCLDSGDLVTIEYELEVQAGTRWFDAHVAPVDLDDVDDGAVVWVARDVTGRKTREMEVRESRERYRSLFENNPAAIWEEDLGDFKRRVDDIAGEVDDLDSYLEQNPDEFKSLLAEIEVLDVNERAVDHYEAESKEMVVEGLDELFTDVAVERFRDVAVAIAEGRKSFRTLTEIDTFEGNRKQEILEIHVPEAYGGGYERVYVTTVDVTDLVDS